jgi:hypothetical protein
MLIRVFRQQATQVATTIMAAAHLLPMEANTWWTMATANIITPMATTTEDPRTAVLIMVCRTMATKSRPMAWEEATNEMITVVIIKVIAPVITITTTCQDIIKVIKSPCKQAVVHLALMATVWMGVWEVPSKDHLLWFITKKQVGTKAPPSLILACQAAIIMAPGIMKMVLQWALAEEADLTSNLTKIRDMARNTISNHMSKRGERASKITSNSHTPRARGNLKITITMRVVSTINTIIKTTMAEFTVPHHKVILMLRRVKMTRLLLKLIKMKLYKKL